MNELKVNLENLTTEERKQLTTLLEKSQQPKRVGTWFPKIGEFYWFPTSSGTLCMEYTDCERDHLIFEIQDPCKTEEECQQKIKQKKALIEVNRQVRDIIANEYPGWVCDWNNDAQSKFYPCFDHDWWYVCIPKCHYIQTQFLFEYAPAGVWERIDEALIKKAMGV